MKTLRLSSDELRAMVARTLERDVYEVEETDQDNGFMSICIIGEHDEFPLYVPLVPFLSAFYGVDTSCIRLSWDGYNWRYTAEVTFDA